MPLPRSTKMSIAKKRIPRRRTTAGTRFLIVLMTASFVVSADAAPPLTRSSRVSTGPRETLASASSSSKKLPEEVGNPSELAWQAWLLVDGHASPQNSASLDSASLLRRITPKSIFIAPALTACADGYQADTMNRCIKDVSIDKQAHHGFLVERLNALFGNAGKPQFSHLPSSSSASSSSSLPTGPLQLNIPLLMPEAATRRPPEKPNDDQESSKTKILQEVVSPVEKKTPDDAILTVYEVDAEAAGKNQSGSSSGNENHPGKMEETTEDLKVTDDPNVPGGSATTGDRNSSEHLGDEVNADEEVSPTVVLLLSPTKLPASPSSGNNDVIVAHNSSLGRIIIRVENATGNMTGKEIIRVSMPENLPHPGPTTASTIRGDPTTTTTTSAGEIVVDEKIIPDESTEIYDAADDDADYEDDSTEFYDEILKLSEAGMTVTVRSKIDEKSSTDASTGIFEKSTERESNDGEITSRVSVNRDFVRETTFVGLDPTRMGNFSASTGSGSVATLIDDPEKEEQTPPGGQENISSEESRLEAAREEDKDARGPSRTLGNPGVDSRDVSGHPTILNETLRGDARFANTSDVGSKSGENVTRVEENADAARPEVIYPVRAIEEALEDSLPVESSDSENVETMVAASTNIAGTIITRQDPKFPSSSSSLDTGETNNSGARGASRETPEAPSKPFPREGIYDYEVPSRGRPSNYPPGIKRDDAPPVIRTIDEQRYRPNVDYRHPSWIVPTGERFSSPTSSRRDENYVRFPNYDVPRENRVRFPSDEANSITNDYKERNRRPYFDRDDEVYKRTRDDGGTRSPMDRRREEAYWWLPSEWRDDNDRQIQRADAIPGRPRFSADETSRDRSPMLLRFWTRMPLLRDPSLLYPTRSSSIGEFRRDDDSLVDPRQRSRRRSNYYGDASSHDLSGTFVGSESAMGG